MIFDWLFKRSKKSNNKEAVAPVFIDVPTREDLIKNNQTEMIKLLDQYKKEYKDKLKERLLFSDISSQDLRKDYLENQDIIIKHIMSNNYTNVDEILASGNIKELLEAKLEYLGLYILSEENRKLYKEIELRYAALNEIKKKSYFIRPIQRRAISNELDFLYSNLIICKSNDFATNANCRLYLIRMSQINNYMSNFGNEESKLLNEKKRLITKLANTFIKDKHDNVLSSNMQDLGIVSYLKIELEKYYLRHKEDFKSLDEELYKLNELEIASDNKDELLKQIEELESKYLLLNMFNEIPKSTFKKLYNIKFNILTNGINIFGESVISKEDYGYEYYKNIVNEKLNNLLSGNNQNFNDSFASLCGKSNLINDYFIDAEKVLNSMEKLAVLLSFDRVCGFDALLSYTVIGKNDFKKIELLGHKDYFEYYKSFFQGNNNYGIEWDDNIPLKSILEIMQRRESRGRYKPLTGLYHVSDLTYPYNQLPDGIIKLVPNEQIFLDLNNIFPYREPFKEEKFILPRTIKEYDDDKMLYYYVDELPRGIEKITFHINQYFFPQIPPTVSEIKLLTYEYNRKPLKLSFLDFENSVFLRNKEKFVNLLKYLGENTAIYKNGGIIIELKSGGLLNSRGLFKVITIVHKLYYDDELKIIEQDYPDSLEKLSYYDDLDSFYDEIIMPKIYYIQGEEQKEEHKIKKKIC